MGSREAYNSCMKPHISGKHEDRKMDFCIGAKICSGKAKDEDEARRLCLLPKEAKEAKGKKGKKSPKTCEKEVFETGQCMLDYFTANDIYKQVLNINSVGVAIVNALLECQCQK